jgi:hypothetical protein
MIAATRLALLDLRHAWPYNVSGQLPPVTEFAGGSQGKKSGG